MRALVSLTSATSPSTGTDRAVAITIDDLPVVAVSSSSDWASVTERLLAAYRSRDTYVGATGPSWLVRWAVSRGIQVPDQPREEKWVADVAGGAR